MTPQQYVDFGIPVALNTQQSVLTGAEDAVKVAYIDKVEGFVVGEADYDLTLARLAYCYMMVNNVLRLPNNSVAGAGLNDSASRYERDQAIAQYRIPSVATLYRWAAARGVCTASIAFDYILNDNL